MIFWVCTKNFSSGLFHYSKKLFSNLNLNDLKWIDPAEVQKYKDFPIIYNLGNHQMNSEIYKYAYEVPGYVVLHDLNLHFASFYLNDGKYFECGDLVYKIRNGGVWIDNLELYSPAIFNLLCRQKGIIVHSHYAKEILKMWKIEKDIFYIPMGTETFKEDFEKIPFSLGIFGNRGINRNLKETAKVLLKLKEEFPQMELIICGSGRKEGIEDLEFAKFYEALPSEEFYELLSKVQIIFNYRYPVYGETSLSTLEAMARGAVPCVSSFGSYNELKGAIKIKNIEDGFLEIKRLWECPVYLNQISKEARNFVEKEHSIEIWLENWKKFLSTLK